MSCEAQMHVPNIDVAREAAAFGVWEYDVDTSEVRCDARLCELLGIEPVGAACLALLREVVHPDDEAAVQAAIAAALAPGASGVSLLCRLVHRRTGAIQRVAARGGRVSGGGASRLAGIVLPLDADPALEDFFANPEFVRALLANSRVIAWAKDEQHRYTYLSENFQQRLGLARPQWFGKTEAELWGPEVAARLRRDHDALLADERPREMLDEVSDIAGQIGHWVASRFVFRDLAGRRHVGGLGVDVTALREAEAALRTSELCLDAFLDSERFFAWVLDDDEHFVYMNAPFRTRHGIAARAIRAARVEDVYPAHDLAELRRRTAEVHAQDRALQFIDELIDADGQRRWWLKLKFPLREAGRRLLGCLAMDITEQVELRQARDELRGLLRRLQACQEEERKSVARDLHDVLGGTLAVVRSQLALLDTPVVRADTARLDAMTARLREMVDALLSDADRLVTWLRPPSLDHLGLQAALGELAREFGALHGISCVFEAGASLPRLDESHTVTLYRIAQEALTNVVKHAGARRVALGLRLDGEQLQLTVDDDGRGLDGERATRQGFGLFGMRERVGMLHGRLTLESSPLGGARVKVSVPLHGAPP